MAITFNHNDKLYVSGSNVGIGTDSPQRELHIKGDTWAEMRLEGRTFASGHGATLEFYSEGTALADIYASTDKHLYFRTNGTTERMRITSGGNVGIGTTSPENRLHLLTSTTDTTQQLLIQNGSTGDAAIKFNISGKTYSLGIDNSDDDKFKLSAGNLGTNDRLVVDSSGNVGIGTTSPSDKLHIQGSTANIRLVDTSYKSSSEGQTAPKITFHLGGNSTEQSASIAEIRTFDDYDGGAYEGSMAFYTMNGSIQERMRITSAGNVGIGTTSPFSKLEVLQAASGTPLTLRSQAGNSGNVGIRFSIADNTVTTDQYNKAAIYLAGAGATNALGDMVFAVNNSTSSQNVSLTDERMRITSAGNVGIGTTTISGQEGAANGTPKLQVLKTGTTGSYDLVARFGTDQDENNSGSSVLINAGNDRGLLISAGRAASNRAIAHLNLIQYDGNELTDGLTIYQPSAGSSGATSGTNVGIGTTSPSTKLEVDGTGKFDAIELVNGGGSTTRGLFSDGTQGEVTLISPERVTVLFDSNNNDANSFFAVKKDATDPSNATELFRVASSGNVGIGTTSPKTQLHLNDGGSYNNTDANNRLFIERDDHAYILMSGPDDKDQGIHFRNDTDNALVGRIAYQHRSTGDSLRFRVGSSSNNNEFLILNSDGTIQIQGYGAGYLKTDASGNITVDTSTIEDTLDSVTDRGNTTSNGIIVGSVEAVNGGTASGQSATTVKIGKSASTAKSLLIHNENGDAHTWFNYTNGNNYITADTSNTAGETIFRRYNGSGYNEDVRIDSSGNVGIGTTSPSDKLHVNGDIRINNTDRFYVGNNASYITSTSNADIAIVANRHISFASVISGVEYERVRIEEGGNVGIGTTSPSRDLHVKKSNSGGQVRMEVFNSSNTANSHGVISIYSGGASGGDPFLHWKIDEQQDWSMGIDNSDGDKLKISKNFGPGTNDYLTVDTSGNVGIGTTSPGSYDTAKVGASHRFLNTQAPTGNYAVKTLAGGLGGNGDRIGFLTFVNDTNDATHKYSAWIGSEVDGTTANKTGGRLVFSTTGDNSTAGPIERMRITNTGNVGIGNTSPGAKLDVRDGTYSNSRHLLVVDNSNAGTLSHVSYDTVLIQQNDAPTLRLYESGENLATTLASDAGVSRLASSGHLAFHANGTYTSSGWTGLGGNETMRITNNNVGIGTTSPASKLHVIGDIRAGDGTADTAMRSYFSDGTYTEMRGYGLQFNRASSYIRPTHDKQKAMLFGTDGYTWTQVRLNSQNYYFDEDTTTHFSIVSGGNVGIGTTSPSTPLQVVGEIKGSSNIRSQRLVLRSDAIERWEGAANNGMVVNYFGYNGTFDYFRDFVVYNGKGQPIAHFDGPDRRVGIGTTSPDYKLDVDGDVQINETLIAKSGVDLVLQARSSQAVGINSNGTRTMTLDASNNVGIGTTAPQQALHIKGATNALMMLEGDNDNGIAGCYYKTEDTDDTMNRTKGFFGFTGNNLYGNGYFTMWLDNANDNGTVTASEERFRWERDGDFHADGDVIAYSTTTPSDIRLKTDVETIESASEKVSKLRGVEYTWSKGKLAGQREIGLIAQEVEAVVPEVVKEKELPLWDDSGESYKTVDYEKLVALLIESNKEMQEEIKQLKERLDGITK